MHYISGRHGRICKELGIMLVNNIEGFRQFMLSRIYFKCYKIKFLQDELKLLGHIILNGFKYPNPEKLLKLS